jgi:8-oxo-dGTP pyrophosphatase MutT (NUDIX family)
VSDAHGEQLRSDALRVLRDWEPPSPDQAALRERYVAHLEAHPDGLERACSPAHVTASLLVLDPDLTHVLLTLHAKSGRWFQFGGHTEPVDATLAGAALREGVEESGLDPSDLHQDPVPVVLDAHEVPFCGRPGVEDVTVHLDVMFWATARDGAATSVSEESIDVRWWPVDALPDPELSAFVGAAVRRAGRSAGRSAGQSTSPS